MALLACQPIDHCEKDVIIFPRFLSPQSWVPQTCIQPNKLYNIDVKHKTATPCQNPACLIIIIQLSVHQLSWLLLNHVFSPCFSCRPLTTRLLALRMRVLQACNSNPPAQVCYKTCMSHTAVSQAHVCNTISQALGVCADFLFPPQPANGPMFILLKCETFFSDLQMMQTHGHNWSFE